MRPERKALERAAKKEWLADAEYTFDAIFDASTPTSTVYRRAAADVVPSVVRGGNCTLLAYGQTASGKSYTMLGEAVVAAAAARPSARAEPGIISLAVADVLRLLGEAEATQLRSYRLRVSCLEVYHEQCNDLLAPERSHLKLYERAGGVLVPGLSEWAVADVAELEALLCVAERQRHVGATSANDRSSRSHLLCSLTVDSWARESEGADAGDADGSAGMGAGAGNSVQQSTLQLVDLAGSERRHAATGEQQAHEGASINKSLLTLSAIIHALADGASPPMPQHGLRVAAAFERKSHLPFRDSKLTRCVRSCGTCNMHSGRARAPPAAAAAKYARRPLLHRARRSLPPNRMAAPPAACPRSTPHPPSCAGCCSRAWGATLGR